MILQWRFQMVDTWFFREARSHDAFGAIRLNSEFPPPVSTLYGVIRTCLGNYMNVDWVQFAHNKASSAAHNLLGDSHSAGTVQIAGMHLTYKDEILYPAPLDLLKYTVSSQTEHALTRLQVGNALQCDLGYVALPQLPEGIPAGCKPIAPAWLNSQGLAKWLAGELPLYSDIVKLADLVEPEPRIGIARDVRSGSVKESMLYQVTHLRAKQSFYVDLYVQGVPEDLATQLPEHSSVRLGGEGRSASVQIRQVDALPLPPIIKSATATHGLTLLLASPGDFSSSGTDTPRWCLPGFTPCVDKDGYVTHWQGRIANVGLNLISCVQERMLRRGGWELAKGQSKPVTSFAAPGSVFYCTLDSAEQDVYSALQSLHGYSLSGNSVQAPGLLMAGVWLQ